jgi:hypothetical protein
VKRTELRRYTEMPRAKKRMRPVSKATASWKRRAAAERTAYMAEHLRCAVCAISALAKPSRTLQCHHIMSRGGRRHECPENWLSLCDRCHRHFHSGGEFGDDGARLPDLTGGHLLWAKDQADGLDVELLAGLRGWKGLPDEWQPAPLPAAFMVERERNL